ncbi:Arm DNA-binding domain-containing protein [Pseudomonas sp. RTB3]|nr:Arm DNA-binding domain-containing protein [Pseudomonas sp. RTB3]
MALTDTAIKQAKPASKPYTLTDGDGLSLQVPTTGSKRWHFRFYWHDKQLRISLGIYPDVSLKEARQRREAARALVANNIDPRSHRRAERQKPLTPPTTPLKRLLVAGMSSEEKTDEK